MNVLGLLLVVMLLSSCEQVRSITDSPHEKDAKETHDAIAALYDRFTEGTRENPCLDIGSEPNCYYVIKIDKRLDVGVYQGKYSVRVCEQNKASGNPFELCDGNHWNPAMHKFKVNGNPDPNLKPGSDYDLYSQPNTDVLTCHDPNTPAGNPTTTCVERTTAIDPA
jgi:hypothetical protein